MDSKPKLTSQRIARSALELIDADGLEAFSLAKLATALNAGTNSIYTYFKDKAAVLEAATQLVLAEVEAPADELEWKDVVRRIMWSFRHVALRHPHMVGLLQQHPPRTPGAMAFRERGWRALSLAGFDGKAIVENYLALAAYSFGTAVIEANQYVGPVHADQHDAGDLTQLLPYTTKLQYHLSHVDYDKQFAFGLEMIIAGFERLMPPE